MPTTQSQLRSSKRIILITRLLTPMMATDVSEHIFLIMNILVRLDYIVVLDFSSMKKSIEYLLFGWIL